MRPASEEHLARVRTRALQAYAHQDLPFEKLVEALAPRRDLSRNPLFQASLVLQNTPPGELKLEGLDVQRLEGLGSESAKFDLDFELTENPGRLSGSIQYATDLFEAGTIERLVGHWRVLLEAIVADPGQAISKLPLLTEAERHQLLVEWNDTAVEYPRERCIHQLFEAQVERTPEATALVYEDQQLTYGELNARANRLAHHLRSLGVGPEVLVGVCLERSLELVVGLLAVLKAGGAYVPLDPSYPAERLAFMLEDTQAPVLLTQQRSLARLPAYSGHTLCLDRDAARFAQHPETNPPGSCSPTNLAYVIYTSGSTGKPKGVMVEQRSVVNHMLWMQRRFPLSPADRILQKTPASADASVWEFFAPLTAGAQLVMAAPDVHRSPVDLMETAWRYGVTVIQFVPSLLTAVLESRGITQCDALRRVFCGGEILVQETARRFRAQSNAELVNLYGPTEVTIDSTFHVWGASDDGHSLPIGKPVDNLRAYVVDRDTQLAPAGVAGELLLGGVGVARGYLRQPALTADRFIANPFAGVKSDRLYRTGDLVRRRNDGVIEFLGRRDAQLKVRGNRIEPGEIEAVLAEHPAVRQAAVLVREYAPGDKRLVAYVATHDESWVQDEPLRALLRERLPEYMRPAAYVFLPRLPLTPNGKVDRKALPAPDSSAFAHRAYEAPVGEIETALAQIWAKVLRLERVGRRDHFFELGGHSLLAVTLLDRMRQSGLHVDIEVLFGTPTLAQVAAAANFSSNTVKVAQDCIPPHCSDIVPEMLPLVQLTHGEIERITSVVPGGAANIQDIYPLAPLQEGILFHHQIAREGDPYLMSALFAFDSRRALEEYVQALQAVVDRHDILRTSVLWEGLPEPVQVVWRRAPLAIEEVSLSTGAGDIAQQLRARYDPRGYRLDVRKAPLMRIYIARDEENARWLMLQLFHHLSTDHTAQEVMQQEIEAHLQGRAGRLPAPLPFRNFIAHARLSVSQEEHKAFFQEMLGNVDEPTTPFGLSDVYGEGGDLSEVRQRVGPPIAIRLRECARTLGVSAASVYHLAWAKVLAGFSGRDDVVFGTVLFGRMQGGSGEGRALGLFMNTLPVRIQADNANVQSSVRHTHALLTRLLHHEHASLALAQRCSAVAAPTPLFSVLLNYRYSAAVTAPSGGIRQSAEGMKCLSKESRTNYPLTLSIDDLGEEFELIAQARSPIDPGRVCAFMRTALERLVDALEHAPDTPLRDLDVLPESERQQLLIEWNDTAVEYPRERCIHQIFEAQVERSPEATALVYETQQLTYRELNARANRLAHHLRSLGVGPEVLVGVCLERSLELVVGLLAVLKAGGAYVPLDPSYPAERLAFMLEDTQAPVLVTHSSLLDKLPPYAGHSVCLQRDAARIAQRSDSNPPPSASPTNLAYVIYTSGSTGKPKGVMIEQRSVVNYLSWIGNTFPLHTTDRVLQKTPISFDASVEEIFFPLSLGAVLVVTGPESHLSAEELIDAVQETGITVLQVVPSLLASMLDHTQFRECKSLRLLLCGAEVLTRELAERVHDQSAAELVNLYGPTETTISSTFWRVPRNISERRVPIGRPVANTKVVVVDDAGQLLPAGVPGQLCVAGSGVARGYLNRPELTRERFVPDRFWHARGGRLYLTGDRVRLKPDGTLEFLGRCDQQLKIRGFRIEPEEVEATLSEHPGVADVAVVGHQVAPGGTQLVAYYLRSQTDVCDSKALRAYLQARLPEHMVPAFFIGVESLPRLPNGKVDRSRLPAPGRENVATDDEFVAPSTPVEQILVDVWRSVLQVDRIGIHDNFFEIGGHSLLVAQVVARIRDVHGVPLSIRDLFAHPNVAALSRIVETLRTAPPTEQEPGLVPAARQAFRRPRTT